MKGPKESDHQVFIRGLKVSCHIGVPDAERVQAQELLVHVTMARKELPDEPAQNDDIGRTIDYHAVAVRLEEIAAERPRKLIETLSEDFADMVLREFSVAAVTVEIEKFILPNTQCVGVITTRRA